MANTINMESGRFEDVAYTPKCKCGYEDCVVDPEYIRSTYPSWWATLQSSDGISSCDRCVNGSNYDDEDK